MSDTNSVQERVYFDFGAAEKKGLSAGKTLDLLRNKQSNINWQDLESSAKDYALQAQGSLENTQELQDKFMLESIKNDKNLALFRERKLNDTSKYALKDSEGNINWGNIGSDIFQDIKDFSGFGHEDFKSEHQKQKEKDLAQNIALKGGSGVDLDQTEADYLKKKLGAHAVQNIRNQIEVDSLSDEYFKQERALLSKFNQDRFKNTLEALNKDDVSDLSPEQKALIKDDLGWWNTTFGGDEKEQFNEWKQKTIAEQFIAPKLSKFLEFYKQMDKSHDIFTFTGQLLGADENLLNKTEFLEGVEALALSAGFDGIGYDANNHIYFRKDDTFYKPNQDFMDNFGTILEANKFSLAGSVLGSLRGLTRGVQGAIAGGAIGAFLGGSTDYALAQTYLGRDINFADMARHGAQEGMFEIVGGLAAEGIGRGIKALPNMNLKENIGKVIDYTPLLGFAKRAMDGNALAAAQLINKTYTKEQQAALKAFGEQFGGEVDIGKATQNLETLKARFGEDSKITGAALKAFEILSLNNQTQIQKGFLQAIRADESGNLLAFITEVANMSPRANDNLKSLLNQTTHHLQRNLERLNVQPKDIKGVFDDLERANKQSYAQAMEDILGAVYGDSYKVVLSREGAKESASDAIESGAKNTTKSANLSLNAQKEHDSALNLAKNQESYDQFRKRLEGEGIKLDDLGFLKYIENVIYNPKGVTFKQLQNALKTLNAYYKIEPDPNVKSHIKNAIEGFLRTDIKRGIEQIFAQNKALYKDASALFHTALNDYATMKETLRLVDKLKLRDEAMSYNKALSNIITFMRAQGGDLSNFHKLTKGLDKPRIEVLELNILQDLFKSSLFEAKNLKVFDSQKFFKALGELEGEFQTKSAQDFIHLARGFDELFKNDALIASSLRGATTQEIHSSIATSVSGAAKFQITRMMFDQIVRLMPQIPFMRGFNEKVQGAALRYHLKAALSKSLDVSDFKFNLASRANLGTLTTPTQEIMKNIIKSVDSAQDEIISAGERASLGDLTESVESRALTGKGVESVDSKALETSAAKPIILHTDGIKSYAQLNKEFKEAITPILNTDITNKETGITARISANESKKMISKPAIDKSIENGFTKEEHIKASANVKELFEEANLSETHADSKGRADIANVLRFRQEIDMNGKNAVAKITAFEKVEGNNKIYTLELENLESPAPLSHRANTTDAVDSTMHSSRAPHNTPGEFIESSKGNDSIESKIAQDSIESTESKALESSAGREVAEKSAQSAVKSEAQESAESSYKTLENGDIVFKDNKGKEHILDKQTQDLWKNTFNLKNIDDEIIPQIPQEIAQQLGKSLKFKIGSLFKIVSRKREKYIPHIKETFENPQAVFVDDEGLLIFAKKINDKQYFTSISADKGEYFVSISLSPKTNNNLENKLKNAKEVYRYPNPESNSPQRAFTDTTSRANNSDKPNSTIESKILQNEAGEQEIFKMQDVKIDTMEDFTKYAQMVGIEFKDEKQAKEAFKFIRRVGGGLNC